MSVNQSDQKDRLFLELIEYLVTGKHPHDLAIGIHFEEAEVFEMMSSKHKPLDQIHEYFTSDKFNGLLRVITPTQLAAVKLIMGYCMTTRSCPTCTRAITS